MTLVVLFYWRFSKDQLEIYEMLIPLKREYDTFEFLGITHF